jgi:hypothetical protein
MTHTEFDTERMRNPNLIVTCGGAQCTALALARGCYQRALLTGRETLSGAGLQGKARVYSAHYQGSRANLLERLTDAGVEWSEVCGHHGKRILVLGPVPAAPAPAEQAAA